MVLCPMTCLRAGHSFLETGPQILDRDLAQGPFIVAHDRDERHPPSRRVLQLLPELVRLGIHVNSDAAGAQ